MLRTHRIPYTSDWKHLISSRPDKNTRYGLTRFGHFCSANGISPRQVDTIVLNVFAGALREGTLHRKADEIIRRTATLWNRLVERCPELGLRKVDLPSRRTAPTRTPWSALPPPSSKISRITRPGLWGRPVRSRRPRAAARTKNRDSARQLRSRRGDGAVASGIAPEQITSLAVLVTPENFKLILRRRFEQAGEKPNAFNDGLAKALLAIAREWVKPSPEVLLELKNLSSSLPTLQPGLTEKNKVLLRAFDDENLQSELLNLPEFLLENALQKRPSVRSLADAQAALAIALLPYCALRMANLARLEFGRTLFLPKRDGDETVVEFPRWGDEEPAAVSSCVAAQDHGHDSEPTGPRSWSLLLEWAHGSCLTTVLAIRNARRLSRGSSTARASGISGSRSLGISSGTSWQSLSWTRCQAATAGEGAFGSRAHSDHD